MVASLFAGCGESPTTQANDELRAAIDVARRHYQRAAGAMGVLPEAPASDPRQTVRENPDVLVALGDADRTLSAALAAGADAGRETRALAQQLLADVRMAAGEYRGLLVRGRMAALTAQGERVAAQAERLGRLAALCEATQTFLSLSDGPGSDKARPLAADLKGQAAERLADLDKEIAALRNRAAQIRSRIGALQATVDRNQTEATALRQQTIAAQGVMVLELDERASATEAQVEKAEGDISLQEVALQDALAAADRLQLQREATAQLVASLDAWMNGLDGRRQGIAGYAGQLDQRVAEQGGELAKLADALADQFDALLAEGQAALDAGRKAADANAAAATLLRQLRQDAQTARTDNPESPMMPVLESQSSQGLLASVTAQGGNVALLRASLQHRLVDAHGDLARLKARVDGLCGRTGLSAPEGLARAVGAFADVKAAADDADQQYQAADKAFNDVAERMLVSSPVNTRGTEWMYKGARAQALYGRYELAKLRGDSMAGTYRDSASQLVNEVLEGRQGDPVLAPIEQIAKHLRGD
ncbi:MAG: hypothetical protein GX591_03110 [Planctomycetes bacterium]|nr:hypothetical protein [Planctomycetota bacterium]